jgi:hypothetical protein
MSKIIFYLHATVGQSSALADAAIALASHSMFGKYALHLAVMTPCTSDLLAIPAGSHFLAKLDLIVEVTFPAGQPINTVDRSESCLLLGYQRTFQESGKKPLRYHYLMFRGEDYSRADYLDYYIHSHYRFGVATPLADYYQNYLDQEGGRELAALFGVNAHDADNISELRFERLEDYVFSDVIREIAPEAATDEQLFVNRDRCQSFSMDVILDSRPYC